MNYNKNSKEIKSTSINDRLFHFFFHYLALWISSLNFKSYPQVKKENFPLDGLTQRIFSFRKQIRTFTFLFNFFKTFAFITIFAITTNENIFSNITPINSTQNKIITVPPSWLVKLFKHVIMSNTTHALTKLYFFT